MLTYETCSYLDTSISLYGYSGALIERKNRITVPYEKIGKVSRSYRIVFLESRNIDEVIKVIHSEKVTGVTISRDTINILNKKFLRNLKRNKKILEINLSSLELHDILKVVRLSLLYEVDIVMSSFWDGNTNIWTPLAKESLVGLVGGSRSDALWYVYHLPSRLWNMSRGLLYTP